MEVKIPKEIRSHRESIFFGLSLRGFVSENFYYTALGRKERDDFD